MADRRGRGGRAAADLPALVNQIVPVAQPVGKGKERTPPTFHGEAHEDVDEWLHQFDRVAAFNVWNPDQRLRNLGMALEGVAERWLATLHPQPASADEFRQQLLATFKSQSYELELESQLRSRVQGVGESPMTYCHDVIYLCSKIDHNMAERIKVQHILRGLQGTLIEKVYPSITPESDTREIIRQIQLHSQAAVIANRSTAPIPTQAVQQIVAGGQVVAQIVPRPSFVTEEQLAETLRDLRKKVREEVTTSVAASLRDILREELRAGDGRPGDLKGDRQGGAGWERPGGTGWERPGNAFGKRPAELRGGPNRSHDGKPICNGCGKPGHIQRFCKTCFTCGKPGHIARVCQQRSSTSAQGGENQGAKAIEAPSTQSRLN